MPPLRSPGAAGRGAAPSFVAVTEAGHARAAGRWRDDGAQIAEAAPTRRRFRGAFGHEAA